VGADIPKEPYALKTYLFERSEKKAPKNVMIYLKKPVT
jgi:hypothetical protein